MRREEVTYMDFNGNERTDMFYFNLNKAELMEMELSEDGGLQQHLIKMVETKDNKKIVESFKDLLLRSYGEKAPDGIHFIKSEELSNKFKCSNAYSELFMKLALNAEYGAQFVNDVTSEIRNIKPNPIPPAAV